MKIQQKKQRPSNTEEKKVMTEEELRELLLSTISKIKKHNEWEKQLS